MERKMKYFLVVIMAIASSAASAELQTWLIEGGAGNCGNCSGIIGEFNYDSTNQKITDWGISTTIDSFAFFDPITHSGPIGPEVDTFFAPSTFNSAEVLSPTELRFTTGTSPMSLAALDIKLFSPLPAVQSFQERIAADARVSLFNGSPWCSSGCGVGGQLLAIPEPSSIAFLAMGVALVILQRTLRYQRSKYELLAVTG
jgi:hypothetical protein